MHTLHGKIALVTGGNRGVGRAVALALGRAGVAVALSYRAREDEARQTCAQLADLGVRCVAIQADVSIAADVARLTARVAAELGAVEILVNNAGIARQQPVAEITEADWNELIAVNLTSAFLLTQAVLPAMRAARWGRIINISSVAAQVGGVVGPHYAASKAGMLGLTHAYAALLAREGITANAVAPALIETEMLSGLNARPEMLPVGRFGTVDEVAEVVLLLAANGYITGQTINVNGGWYMS